MSARPLAVAVRALELSCNEGLATIYFRSGDHQKALGYSDKVGGLFVHARYGMVHNNADIRVLRIYMRYMRCRHKPSRLITEMPHVNYHLNCCRLL